MSRDPRTPLVSDLSPAFKVSQDQVSLGGSNTLKKENSRESFVGLWDGGMCDSYYLPIDQQFSVQPQAGQNNYRILRNGYADGYRVDSQGEGSMCVL